MKLPTGKQKRTLAKIKRRIERNADLAQTAPTFVQRDMAVREGMKASEAAANLFGALHGVNQR